MSLVHRKDGGDPEINISRIYSTVSINHTVSSSGAARPAFGCLPIVMALSEAQKASLLALLSSHPAPTLVGHSDRMLQPEA